jgi:hypothetical protein
MDWYSRIGFIETQRKLIDTIEGINDDSMRRLFELANPRPLEILGTLNRGDDILILKLKEDIRQNVNMLGQIGLGTPILIEVKKRIKEGRNHRNVLGVPLPNRNDSQNQ